MFIYIYTYISMHIPTLHTFIPTTYIATYIPTYLLATYFPTHLATYHLLTYLYTYIPSLYNLKETGPQT